MKIWLALVCCLAGLPCGAGDWQQFRGPQGAGLAADADLPTNLDAKRNLAWRIDLPGRGHSSPVIVGDRVFITCATGAKGGRLHILCLDANTGAKHWERQFWATGQSALRPRRQPATANAFSLYFPRTTFSASIPTGIFFGFAG